MIIWYCDICKKEISKFGTINFKEFTIYYEARENNDHMKKIDVCEDCIIKSIGGK